MTIGADAVFTPIVWLLPLTIVTPAVPLARPVAVIVVDAPVAIDALNVCAPTVGPSVQITVALPFKSVVLVEDDTLPPPVNTVHVTVTLPIGLPAPSVTCTDTGCGSAWPTIAL